MSRKIVIGENSFNSIFEELLFNEKENLLLEADEITKTEVKNIAKEEIRKFLRNNRDPEFDEKIQKIVKNTLKTDSELSRYIVEITKNVLVELYKSFWVKRNFWTNDLKNVRS